MILLSRQSLGQRGGRLAHQFRRRSVDNGQDRFLFWRKRFFERHLALAPRELLGNQLVDVGVDGEMAGRVNGGDKTQNDRDAYDPHGVAGTIIDDSDDRLLQHCLKSWALRALGRSGMSQNGRRNIRQFSALTTTKGCTGTLPEHPPVRINPKNSLKFGEAEGSLTEIHDDLGCACANLYGKMLESCPPCRSPLPYRWVLLERFTTKAVRRRRPRLPLPAPVLKALGRRTAGRHLLAKSRHGGP